MLQLIVESAKVQPPQTPPPSFCVTVYFRDVKKKTRVIEDNNPTWNETLVWHLGPQLLETDSFLQVILRDISQKKSERTFGVSTVFLRPLAENPHEPLDLTELPLVSHTTYPTKSTITLKITYLPQMAQHKSESWQSLGMGCKEAEGQEIMATGHNVRMPLTLKPQDFQVQVRIFEARQLHGNNIEPVVKILIGKHEHRTRIKKGNNPFFNEVGLEAWGEGKERQGRWGIISFGYQAFFFLFFFFPGSNYSQQCIKALAQKDHENQLWISQGSKGHWLTIFSRSSLEKFLKKLNFLSVKKKLDLHQYTQTGFQGRNGRALKLVNRSIFLSLHTGHTLMRKWLGLCHSNKPYLGIRGYLKVTVSVLGAGDEAPVRLCTQIGQGHFLQYICGALVDHGHLHETGEMEKNLFMSAIVPIQLATFCFYIYSAEDLHFSKTSKVLHYLLDSQYFILLPYGHPTFEYLRKKSNSLPPKAVHGTKLHEGEFSGFLPCFGPSYLILHGGEKALSWNFSDEEPFLLDSTEEGLIYQGRVLMELVCGIQDKKAKALPPRTLAGFIENELNQQNYGLCIIFLSSTMMPAFKSQIHFEVTLGHYGSKMDLNYKPLTSTTQYSQAVVDDTSYHYVPWHNSKPVVTLTSTWEDVSFRMNSLNVLHVARDRLKSNLEAMKSFQNPKNPALSRVWKKLLEELMEDCKRPLPHISDQLYSTILDQNLWKLRKLVLQELADEAMNSNHKDTEMLPAAENWLYRLNSVTLEPQSSIPDVVIWLLCKEHRVAYTRVPINTILFSQAGPFYGGKFCGKAQTLFMKVRRTLYSKERKQKNLLEAQEQKGIMAAQLRVCMWLGSVSDSSDLEKIGYKDFIFYSKTYENQAMFQGKWGPEGLKNYPNFSDASGNYILPKENFHVPQGWEWQGSWFVEPKTKFLVDTDINQNQILEEVYENQTRDIWGSWAPAAIPNTDMIGQPVQAREQLECPEGWSIKENWNVELNDAVDKEGWEYGVGNPPSEIPKAWTAVEKTYHSWRRRRWVRQRYQNPGDQQDEQKSQESPDLHGEDEGWEYDSFGFRFDPDPKPESVLRRRCWHRRMVPTEDVSMSPIFFLEECLAKDNRYEEIEEKEEKKKKKIKEEEQGEVKKEEKNLMTSKKSLMEAPLKLSTPFISYIIYKPQYYQLFCYIYQVRNLISNHIQTFSDSFIQVIFLHYSQRTRTLETSLVPTWSETLIFDHILLDEKPQDIEENPPPMCLELWQVNSQGKRSLWGRSMCSPVVYLDLQKRTLPPLNWHSISKETGEEEGEILASFELILETEMTDNQKSPLMSIPWKNGYYTLPQNIQPSLKKTAIEILAWGLRNIHKAYSPSLVVECGEETLNTAPIKDYHSNPNFPQAALLLTVFLPQEEAYTPPLVLKVVDQQNYGIQMVIGQAIVYCLRPYFCDPWAEDYVPPRLPGMKFSSFHCSPLPPFPPLPFCPFLNLPSERNWLHFGFYGPLILPSYPFNLKLLNKCKLFQIKGAGWCFISSLSFPPLLQFFDHKNRKHLKSIHTEEEHMHEVDWWSKMFWATGENSKTWNHKDYYALKIYDCELEAVPDFQGLQDFCQTFNLYSGQKTKDSPIVGEFKGLFRVYPLPENPKQASPPRQFQNLPEKESCPQQCLVRVYVIRAIGLQPKDNNGLCDPYVILKLGKTMLGNRHHYKPNTVDPVFGMMFEMNCTIPLEKDLEITLFDFDLISPDDKIGSTVIDLEDRLLSTFGARCGLPKSYCLAGPFQWRDQLTPSHLLEQYAHRKGLPPPDFSDEDCIIFSGRIFRLQNFEQETPPIKHLGSPKERLALYLLQAQGQVPEHVETRTLYSNTQPGIDQGKVQLWVDIFPLHLGPPGPAVNISLRKAKGYELRCIIWETRNVDLQDVNITGERMSDIYIKGWMHDMEEDMQKTDIHYRSLTGSASFNWRFIFTFKYLPTEQVCILSKKEFIWSLDPTVEKIPPRLLIQVWDNDKFLPDDFLGILELDLCEMPTPARSSHECTLNMIENKPKWPFKFLHKHVSLFRQKTLTGWWPCQVLDDNKWRLSGKVKMTLEVLTRKEAEERPAGRGRSEPNQYPTLHAPIRPETSFLWFLSPWLSFQHICWNRYRWKFTLSLLIMSLLLLVIIFIYSTPNYLAMKLIKPEFRLTRPLPALSEESFKEIPTTTLEGLLQSVSETNTNTN
ncbi:fer-1-like protein 5 [Antechinus flavipes]|uniref:fer-1-like protein 5 n=1 Tax=Antechinus flavipes TaxID=38775 RepID=UPI002236129A|nr:fer-1-like protein 5 [Antechinus flavipes]